MILSRNGKYDEADPLHHRADPTEWRRDGNQEELAAVLNNYGTSLHKRNEYAAAVPFFRESLEIRRRDLRRNQQPPGQDAEQPRRLTLDKVGRYKEAEALYTEALTISQTLYPEGHPDTVIKLNNLATVRQKQGAYAEAEVLAGARAGDEPRRRYPSSGDQVPLLTQSRVGAHQTWVISTPPRRTPGRPWRSRWR